MSDVFPLTEQQREKLAVTLGLKQPVPDPQKLTAELQARDAALREQAIENAVLRNAGRYGGNGTALADSNAFMATVARLDPSAGSFGDDLGDAIKAAVESGSRFRAPGAIPLNEARTTAPPGRSVGEQGGGANGPRQWTVEDVDRLPHTREGRQQLSDAIEAGLLVDLGVGPSRRR
jgi:hypothetical protein